MKLTIRKAKAQFLDRPAILAAIGKAQSKVLIRQGLYLVTVMNRSMKKRKGHAAAGAPPNEHRGDLERFNFAAWDTVSKTVVVGPAAFEGTRSKPAPGTLEHGGPVNVQGVYDRKGKFTPLFAMSRAGRQAAKRGGKIVVRVFQVEPRPFAKPAGEKSAAKLATFWKDAIRK